ncbi:restriction endonuclease subunit S [Micrococcus luteus]|uniref:restriction endonuclease subunit S n=1 Tax=Micrococcus luteus TaxID=1270 RepID=UPI002005BD73|nr:restriction endonuclease subunit S [Micrococcus luteus]MCV7506938.1 restriction endonuclease subunit S [Micrococcus luteus]MCV7547896.1 restriction endonuclease subunit S [Micrococcus luteus]
MTARSSSRKFGWCVDLVSDNAPEESEFRVAAESMVGHTGRLVTDHQIDSEGRGTSFRAGDLLFSKLRPYLAKSWVANRDGEALGDIHVYRPVDEMCSRYLGYLVLSSFFLEQVNASTYGTKMPRANWDFIKTIEVWAPDFDTQRRIADYLDRETATIDALIEKQRALAGALRERRSAAIEHALQAAADRRLLLKRLVSRVDQGISPDTSSATGLEDIWVLKSGASNDGFFNEEASKPVPESVTVPLGIELHEGDLVVSRASGSPRLVGSAAIVGQLSRRLVLSDKNFRLVPSQNVWVRYLYWALNSQIYREQVLRSISGAEGLANNLPLSKLMNFTVPVPPLEEQREIADHLDRETATIDALIAKAERFIELARERRAALITAAVTGQIEIPTED